MKQGLLSGLAGAFALLMAVDPATAQSARFAIAGAANTSSSGLENPYGVLGRPEVQALAYEALQGPMTRQRINALLSGSEVTLDHLIATDVLRPAPGGTYALAFTVMTIDDKRLVRRVADPAGRSLATAILAERPRFDAILNRYDLQGVDRSLVAMALIGCVMLDWDGLGVTADGGYRIPPQSKPNGDKYQMVMLENAPDVSVRALYWGSHNTTAANNAVVMSTFGDHEDPQRLGFPDIVDRIGSSQMSEIAPRQVAPVLAAALGDRLSEHQDNAARMMVALRGGPLTVEALATAARLDVAEARKTLRLLTALRYVRRDGETYTAKAPVFTVERDGAMIAEFRALGQDVMRRWLSEHYDAVRGELSGLSSARAGVAYDLLFTQIWHDLFGWTNYHLVQSGYLYDPYGPSAEYVSFVPFVWEAPLNLYEGTRIF